LWIRIPHEAWQSEFIVNFQGDYFLCQRFYEWINILIIVLRKAMTVFCNILPSKLLISLGHAFRTVDPICLIITQLFYFLYLLCNSCINCGILFLSHSACTHIFKSKNISTYTSLTFKFLDIKWFYFFVGLGFELRALCLQSKGSTT
jgi:hypothetical protein